MEVLTVIEVSVDIPNDGVQFSPAVPQEIRDQIVAALVVIDQNEAAVAAMDQAYEWTKLVEKDDTFYDPFRQILDAAGIDAQSLLGE
jgi:phosphonate transport system substrate-binding protein